MVLALPNASAERVLLTRSTTVLPARFDSVAEEIKAAGHEAIAIRVPREGLDNEHQELMDAFRRRFVEAKQLFLEERYSAAVELLRREEASALRLLLETQTGRAVLVEANLLDRMSSSRGQPAPRRRESVSTCCGARPSSAVRRNDMASRLCLRVCGSPAFTCGLLDSRREITKY